MKVLSCIVAATALAASAGGCTYYPYSYSYPRYGYSQAYYYPSSYGYYYPSSYSYYSTPYYYPRSYAYRGDWDAYRNYNGIHAGPELSMAGTVP